MIRYTLSVIVIQLTEFLERPYNANMLSYGVN